MNMPGKIRVFLVDDHPIFRDGICAIIDHQQDLEVVGQAANAAEAIALFDSLAPDVTLVDLGLPDSSGIQLIATLRAKSATARFLVLTANAGGSEIAPAMRAGANAYLFKSGPSEELVTAIRSVACGKQYVSASATQLAEAFSSRPTLSARELEVLKWIVLGHTNAQIAIELGVAEETIRTHVRHVLLKLGVSSRNKAAAMSHKLGLVRPTYP